MKRPFGFTKDRIEAAFRAYLGDEAVVTSLVRELWDHSKEMEAGVARLYPERMFRDMAAGAQMLLVFGAGASRIMPLIRIFSRLVWDNHTSYEEIAKAVGRIGVMGSIRRGDYDTLQRQACILPRHLRSGKTAVTWDELLRMLDRAIQMPTSMKGGS